MNALVDRIRAEELAKTKQCGCIDCTNQATHTHGGHPTCDDCATPMRKENMAKFGRQTFPRIIG